MIRAEYSDKDSTHLRQICDYIGCRNCWESSLVNIQDRKKYELEILKANTQADIEKQRFEYLANTLPSILWTASPSGQVTFGNARFFEWFDVKAENTNLSFLKTILSPEEWRPVLNSWTAALREGHEFLMELPLKGGGGVQKWFVVRVIPCVDENGKLNMWLGSCTDIHLQKEKHLNALNGANLELSSASSKIEHKTQLLKEVAFTQSHLVCSPVSKILALITLLQKSGFNGETKFLLSLLKQSAEELDKVISSLVEISHATE